VALKEWGIPWGQKPLRNLPIWSVPTNFFLVDITGYKLNISTTTLDILLKLNGVSTWINKYTGTKPGCMCSSTSYLHLVTYPCQMHFVQILLGVQCAVEKVAAGLHMYTYPK